MNEVIRIKLGHDKKHLLLIIGLLALTAVSWGGCDSPDKTTGDGTISSAQLTTREQNLLNTLGVEQYFIFDVKLTNHQLAWAHVWIDYYENGRLQSKLTTSQTSLSQPAEESHWLAFTARSDPGSSYQTWSIACDSGNTSMKIEKSRLGTARTWRGISDGQIQKGRDITLGYLAGGENGVSAPDIFDGNEDNLKELLRNDRVYILRCRFE